MEFSPKHPDQLWDPHSLVEWVPRVVSMEVKWAGCEADHSLPAKTKVKNECRYNSTPHACHHPLHIDLTFIMF
jgi:hypothetical protein